MSRWHSYLNTGKKIIEAYDGSTPLAAWLKDFFKQHRQMGSTDRRMITEVVYSFYRLGHAAAKVPADARMLMALFCCNHLPHPLLQHVKPAWNALMHLGLPEKLHLIQQESEGAAIDIPGGIFPWKDELSEGMDEEAFSRSFLVQPSLFLRLRPGKEVMVKQQLTQAGIDFKMIGAYCIALPNSTNVESILAIGKDAIVQDYSSQQTGALFGLNRSANATPEVWDCCAASGGKSIMAYDQHPGISLTVSDVRPSILRNLHQRFAKAGITAFNSFSADLTRPDPLPLKVRPGIIIADVPCSGSGTWARTPEQLYFFDPAKIDYYANLQKSILRNIVPYLQPGGQLIYITCSVFKKENEAVAGFIQSRFSLQLTEMRLLQGYHQKADTLFAASFEKDQV